MSLKISEEYMKHNNIDYIHEISLSDGNTFPVLYVKYKGMETQATRLMGESLESFINDYKEFERNRTLRDLLDGNL